MMEQSNLVLAKILDLAMKNGVSHWSLGFKDLALGDEYATHFYPCIEWLEHEGLIRVGHYSRTMGGIANGSVGNISLTSRGMALLGQSVTIQGSKVTLSDTVRQVSEGRDHSRIGDLIGGFLAGFVKNIGT